MNTHKKAMALSLQQLLNGQRVLRIPELSSCSFERSFSFGSFNIGSLNGKSMELCKEEGGWYLLHPRSEVERYGFEISR